MEALQMLFNGLLDSIQGIVRFFITFFQDTLEMVLMLTKLPAILATTLNWTNSIGVLPYITTIIGLAIVYKILGRE